MPAGWERINARTPQPNKNVVFIKPLPGPDAATAKDFLERIAAQCAPIMAKHHLLVTSLEEYEPNPEFIGRNFNGGEVVQLVLKSLSTGRWLPFNSVQMVMMHELAHNKQMNHSKAFWAVRNEFAGEMKVLWDKRYTGDGLWGRGILLENGVFARQGLDPGETLPEHLCGGTFRSRGNKKRKPKPKITWKEAKERRIKKKFGVDGVTLGADDETKVKLENGKRPAGKPRVAGSARGRELRAAAALARFEAKEEPQMKDEDLVTDSEAESDTDPLIKPEADDALDINGLRLLDIKGGGMVKVCEAEDEDDIDVKRELLELQSIPGHAQQYLTPKATSPTRSLANMPEGSIKAVSRSDTLAISPSFQRFSKPPDSTVYQQKLDITKSGINSTKSVDKFSEISATPSGTCPICSVENDSMALTCMVCSHVLRPDFVPNNWHCVSSTCKDSVYINSGDVGLCGICGTRKRS